MPKFDVNGITLEYQIGDSIQLMNRIPNDSIDLLLTDPPFNVNLDYDGVEDNLSDEDYGHWCKAWLQDVTDKLKVGHYAIIFTGDIKSYWVFNAIMGSGLTFHHFLKWNKPYCQRGLTGTVLFNRTELAFVCSKGKPDISLINRKRLYSDTLIYPNTTGGVEHNARRPVGLYAHIIEGFCPEGGTVLDLFLGSGTTLLACRHTNRNGIGFEINPIYERVIEKRIMADIPAIESYGEVGKPPNPSEGDITP